jgi:hypothetical protein
MINIEFSVVSPWWEIWEGSPGGARVGAHLINHSLNSTHRFLHLCIYTPVLNRKSFRTLMNPNYFCICKCELGLQPSIPQPCLLCRITRRSADVQWLTDWLNSQVLRNIVGYTNFDFARPQNTNFWCEMKWDKGNLADSNHGRPGFMPTTACTTWLCSQCQSCAHAYSALPTQWEVHCLVMPCHGLDLKCLPRPCAKSLVPDAAMSTGDWWQELPVGSLMDSKMSGLLEGADSVEGRA